MNKGLQALKNSGPAGKAAFDKIMGGMSKEEMVKAAEMGMKVIKQYGGGGKMYAEGGITERNAGVFRGSDEQNVYDDLGNIIGTRKETSKLRSLLGADEVLYDNEGNKAAKINEKRNKTKITYYEDGGKNGDGGPFSSAKSQIEENLSPLRGDLISQIESDPKKAQWLKDNVPGGIESATVYQLSQAADPNHNDTQTNRLTRLARQANLPVATETANLYSRMSSGKFNVDVMDQAMLERGYDGEAGDIFATGVVEGKIPLGAMLSAETKDLGTMDDAGRFNFKVFDVPTGAEFLQTNRRRIKGDGSIKGDYSDDLTWYAKLGRGDRRDVSPEVDTPETIIPDPPMQTAPGDPVAALRRRDPGPLPVNRPEPELQGGIRPIKERVPTSDPGLGRFDVGALEPMLSDRLGSTELNRATGPYGTIQEDSGDQISALELAAAIQQLRAQRKMGGRMYLFGGRNKGRGPKKFHSIDVKVKGIDDD